MFRAPAAPAPAAVQSASVAAPAISLLQPHSPT
jgi:hypothetical protein